MAFCGKKDCCTSTGICGTVTHGKGELSDNGYWEFPCEVCEKEEARLETIKRDKLDSISIGTEKTSSRGTFLRYEMKASAFKQALADAYDAGKYSAGR